MQLDEMCWNAKLFPCVFLSGRLCIWRWCQVISDVAAFLFRFCQVAFPVPSLSDFHMATFNSPHTDLVLWKTQQKNDWWTVSLNVKLWISFAVNQTARCFEYGIQMWLPLIMCHSLHVFFLHKHIPNSTINFSWSFKAGFLIIKQRGTIP